VGITNMLRYEIPQNGLFNVPEFGSVTTKEGFRGLLAMDTYHRIAAGTSYPAVLFTHGINDPRVEVWFSGKMAARLSAATSSGKPVLLRIAYDTGHGFGATKAQHNATRADRYAFLWAQLGGS